MDLQQNRIESLDQFCLALSLDYVLLKNIISLNL